MTAAVKQKSVVVAIVMYDIILLLAFVAWTGVIIRVASESFFGFICLKGGRVHIVVQKNGRKKKSVLHLNKN